MASSLVNFLIIIHPDLELVKFMNHSDDHLWAQVQQIHFAAAQFLGFHSGSDDLAGGFCLAILRFTTIGFEQQVFEGFQGVGLSRLKCWIVRLLGRSVGVVGRRIGLG